MRDLILIKVECHSGFKADEYPLSFNWDTVCFKIEQILDRWYQGDKNPDFPVSSYYKVLTTDKKKFILKHETDKDKWFLLLKGESLNL